MEQKPTGDRLPTVTHTGSMKLGDLELTIYTLDDGTRMIDESSVLRFLSLMEGKPDGELEDAVMNVQRHLSGGSLG